MSSLLTLIGITNVQAIHNVIEDVKRENDMWQALTMMPFPYFKLPEPILHVFNAFTFTRSTLTISAKNKHIQMAELGEIDNYPSNTDVEREFKLNLFSSSLIKSTNGDEILEIHEEFDRDIDLVLQNFLELRGLG